MRSNKRAVYTVIYVFVAVAVAIAALLAKGYKQGGGFTDSRARSEADILLHVIDVGQGDAIFIDNGDQDILIDAGPGSAAPRLLEYLEEQDATLEYAFFSHPHEDHIGGGDDVLTQFDVENVVMPDYSEDTVCYRTLMQTIEDRGCDLSYVVSGDSFEIGDITVDILSPGKGYKTNDANKISIIMKVSYGDIDMMFTGDAEETNESYVVRRYPEKLDCEILKVGHHGSSSSSSDGFLSSLTPEIALISVGENNSYGHPHVEALASLNTYTDEVHRTDREGDLVLGITKNKYWFVEE